VTHSFAPTARFDNMRDRTTSILSDFESGLRADTIAEVRTVLSQAEEIARRGLWVAGFVSYECAPAFDKALEVRDRDTNWCPQLPLAWFGVFRRCTTTSLQLPLDARREGSRWDATTSQEDYVSMVNSALREIQAGNAYQVNLTNPVVSSGLGEPRSLYRRLLTTQQPAYGALIEFDGVAIVSASPELFFDWDGSTLRSRPIKGTSRRGRWLAEDIHFASQLVGSPKERAENVMIVDLIRNDMGKVAVVGSVTVPELCALEGYPTVWQLVSEVRCQTRRDVRVIDIFDAMFPCGSVTGAPKPSAMKIIRSLEPAARGIYCGAVGLLRPALSGVDVQFNVAIRTAVVEEHSREARFGSGGGVVADSIPEFEYREMLLKSEMLNSKLDQRFRLVETFRHSPNTVASNLDRHLGRLRRSAQYFGFRVRPSLDALVLRKLAQVDYDARVRLLLSRSGRVEIHVSAAPEIRRTPVTLAIDDRPVDSQSIMLFHKTTRRTIYTERRRRHPRTDDVVLVNERGECTETTTATIAARSGSRWLTPPLSSGCLPGVERARLIEQGVLIEEKLTARQLRSADELAVINSLRGWQTAVLFDEIT
jgi:para-aminobenzoate synthetase / 4-amino-4-deoxychorismate lyase